MRNDDDQERLYRYDPNATFEVREFDLEYLSYQGESRMVRIYQPQGEGPFPVLLSVHGGAWSAGNHENNPVTTRPIARSGVLVAAIGLRVAPEFPYPGASPGHQLRHALAQTARQ